MLKKEGVIAVAKVTIECARKFFAKVNQRINPEHVKYDVVDSFGTLMALVGKGA